MTGFAIALSRVASCFALIPLLSATPAAAQLDTVKQDVDAKIKEANGQLENITSLNLIAREFERLAADGTCDRDRMLFRFEERTSPPVPASFDAPLRELLRCRTYVREGARALYSMHSAFFDSYRHTRIDFDHILATDIGLDRSRLLEAMYDTDFILHWNAEAAGINCLDGAKAAEITTNKDAVLKPLSEAFAAHDIYRARVVLYGLLTSDARTRAHSDICATKGLDDAAEAWDDVAEAANRMAAKYPISTMQQDACAWLALKKIIYPAAACTALKSTPESEYILHQALERTSIIVQRPPTLPPIK